MRATLSRRDQQRLNCIRDSGTGHKSSSQRRAILLNTFSRVLIRRLLSLSLSPPIYSFLLIFLSSLVSFREEKVERVLTLFYMRVNSRSLWRIYLVRSDLLEELRVFSGWHFLGKSLLVESDRASKIWLFLWWAGKRVWVKFYLKLKHFLFCSFCESKLKIKISFIRYLCY